MANRFSIRALLTFTLGVAAAIQLVSAVSPTMRVSGWLGLAVFLLLKRQHTLFWAHVCVPLCLGMVGIVLAPSIETAPALFNEIPQDPGTGLLYRYYLGEASLFMSLMTFPMSFFGIDPS